MINSEVTLSKAVIGSVKRDYEVAMYGLEAIRLGIVDCTEEEHEKLEWILEDCEDVLFGEDGKFWEIIDPDMIAKQIAEKVKKKIAKRMRKIKRHYKKTGELIKDKLVIPTL